MSEKEFNAFPSISRLSREVVVTEKIDGTNAQIFIEELEGYVPNDGKVIAVLDGLAIYAGSRTRWITPDDDNFGFAAWVKANAEQLVTLGPGQHFGEWWGQGIQRKYGLTEKRFSLFNVSRWALHGTEPKTFPTVDPRVVKTQDVLPPCCGLVPVLYRGNFDTVMIDQVLSELRSNGSAAAPGFMNPEGIVVYHTASGALFKKTLDKNDGHKGAA